MEENKLPIGIIADETADIPQNIVEQNKISVVKFKIDSQEIDDVPGNNVYEKIRAAEKLGRKSLVKTSQPSINDFLTAFKKKLEEFENIICVTMSSRISGAYNSALQAKKFLTKELQDRVQVIDSFNGSGGEGLFCLKAIEYVKQGFNINEISNKLSKEVANFKLLGMYRDSRWLEASGRIPKLGSAMINQAEKINIKPVFAMKDGKLTVASIKRNIKDLPSAMFEEFAKQTEKAKTNGKKIIAAITHADNINQAEKLKELILSLNNTEVAFINLVCFPVGGHIGPDSMVVAWEQ